MILRTAAACSLLALFSACSTPRADREAVAWRMLSPAQADAIASPVLCYGPAACARAWQQAQVWALNNSGWKIQLVTDVIIQTYGPLSNERGMAYRITRTLYAEDVEQLVLEAACGFQGQFACVPFATPDHARAAFAVALRNPLPAPSEKK